MRKTHGKQPARLYRIWANMINRCTNPNADNYPFYGGRGIKVCDEWRMDYISFRDWAFSNGYADNLTLDRIDNDGNYEPTNCRWETHLRQCNNTRRNHWLTFNGESHTISEWARIVGMKADTLERRINAHGWSIERALTTSVRRWPSDKQS